MCPHCQEKLPEGAKQDLCQKCSDEFAEYLKRWLDVVEGVGIRKEFSGNY